MYEPRPLEIIVWDVGHGNAATVLLPNGNVLMLDCGSNPRTGFSPVQETLCRWNHIDALFISHPHMDHIGDIRSITYPQPRFFFAPQVPRARVLEGKQGDDLEAARHYVRLASRPAYKAFEPAALFGSVNVSYFFAGGPHKDMNAYSMVTFMQYGSFTFLHAGDLPSNYWQTLMDKHGRRFANLLCATNFFEVPHHGRSEGYSADALSSMPNLRLGLVSDREEQGTSVTGSYDRYFSGWPACNEAAGRWEVRRVLTTRNDGRIRLLVWPLGSGRSAEVRFSGGSR